MQKDRVVVVFVPAAAAPCCCFALCYTHTHTYRETHAHLHFWHHLDARRATDANLIWTPHTKKCARERESAWQGDIPTWRRGGERGELAKRRLSAS